MSVAQSDRHKVKLAVLFSALGIVGFLLTLLAGIGLWNHAGSREVATPTYDRFVHELHATDTSRLPALATSLYEQWHACETSRSGMTNVAIHALITTSIIALALFTLCFMLGLQVLRSLESAADRGDAPQPPEPVDDTWR